MQLPELFEEKMKKLLGTEYELKNRYMHVDYADTEKFQSLNLTL